MSSERGRSRESLRLNFFFTAVVALLVSAGTHGPAARQIFRLGIEPSAWDWTKVQYPAKRLSCYQKPSLNIAACHGNRADEDEVKSVKKCTAPTKRNASMIRFPFAPK